MKREITEAKEYYIKNKNFSRAIERISEIKIDFTQCKISEERIEILYIYADTWRWIIDQGVNIYNSNIMLDVMNRRLPILKNATISLLENFFSQFEEFSIYHVDNSFRSSVSEKCTDAKYAIRGSSMMPYYKMVYYYINSIPNNYESLKAARECFKKFSIYANEEWRLRSLLQSQLYEKIYIAYANMVGQREMNDFSMNLDEFKNIVLGKCRTKEILELFCMVGLAHYMFLNVRQGIQNKDTFMDFLNIVEKIHLEQFTLDEGEKKVFIERWKKMGEYLETAT